MSLRKVVLQKASQVILPILTLLDRLALGEGVLPGKYDTQKDPYSWYKVLRSRAPVVRSYANRGWVVVGFDAVQAIFRDPRFSSDMRKNDFVVGVLRTAADGQEVPFLDNPSMLNLDAPDHTRLRKLVSLGFLKKYIDSLEPNIVPGIGWIFSSNAKAGYYGILSLHDLFKCIFIQRIPLEYIHSFKFFITGYRTH